MLFYPNNNISVQKNASWTSEMLIKRLKLKNITWISEYFSKDTFFKINKNKDSRSSKEQGEHVYSLYNEVRAEKPSQRTVNYKNALLKKLTLACLNMK